LKTSKKSNKVVAKTKKPNVGIMTHATFEKSGKTPLDNLVALINPLTNRLFVITGEYNNSTAGVQVVRVKAARRKSTIARVLQQVLTHARQLRLLFKLRKDIDILVFLFGTPFPVPLIFAQALGMRCFIVLAVEGSAVWAAATKASGTPQQFGEFTRLGIQEACERISYYFSDKLIAYSKGIIDQMKLQRYANKTAMYPKYVSDYDAFGVRTRVEQRQDLIGYVGRLNEEKGILSLLEAIPQVVRERPHLRFIIIGEGRLREEVLRSLDTNNIARHVELVPWVSHRELPTWLNKFKLLVIPSYTEGLPNVMLEAMACGTPVLATPVGGVPDVIEDGKTGFLMNTNTSECIARNIIRAISNPDLEEISKNAYAYVRKEFTRNRAFEAWRQILD
jgi:glycosyltransferase involved in cell wall biosynthesis